MTKRTRILLADDHTLMLEGFRKLLEPQHEVVDSVGDGRALVEAALRLKPDLIILDITMPLLNGIDACRQIKKEWPEARLIFLSMHANLVYLREALSAGGAGFILKSSAREELIAAIDQVMRGRFYVTAHFGAEVQQHVVSGLANGRRSPSRLTDRQREILQLIAEGRANKEIAGILTVSVKTVEFHRGRIMNKLGLRTTAELTRFAVQQGLVAT
jgi:DNA-binding NarL/FixJ family response regulator